MALPGIPAGTTKGLFAHETPATPIDGSMLAPFLPLKQVRCFAKQFNRLDS
jgi:hypothetical protein